MTFCKLHAAKVQHFDIVLTINYAVCKYNFILSINLQGYEARLLTVSTHYSQKSVKMK